MWQSDRFRLRIEDAGPEDLARYRLGCIVIPLLSLASWSLIILAAQALASPIARLWP
jgi:hypothetical protein